MAMAWHWCVEIEGKLGAPLLMVLAYPVVIITWVQQFGFFNEDQYYLGPQILLLASTCYFLVWARVSTDDVLLSFFSSFYF